MKCLQCGEEFTPLTVVQLYCSEKCGSKYRRENGRPERPSITFSCAKCGRTVVTDGIKDKRSRFCCVECEKKYWKHPPWERESNRTNFKSLKDYERYEKWSNG